MVLRTASIKRGASRWMRGGSCKDNKAGVRGRGAYTHHKHWEDNTGGVPAENLGRNGTTKYLRGEQRNCI